MCIFSWAVGTSRWIIRVLLLLDAPLQPPYLTTAGPDLLAGWLAGFLAGGDGLGKTLLDQVNQMIWWQVGRFLAGGDGLEKTLLDQVEQMICWQVGTQDGLVWASCWRPLM